MMGKEVKNRLLFGYLEGMMYFCTALLTDVMGAKLFFKVIITYL